MLIKMFIIFLRLVKRALKRKGIMLHVSNTYTLFYIPASVNTFSYTPLYTFVFAHVSLVLNTKLFSLRLFELLSITIEVSHLRNLCI